MNQIFKVIWNHATQTWMAVSELSHAKGKTKSSISKIATALATATVTTSVATAGVASSSDFHFLSAKGSSTTPATQANYLNDGAQALGSLALGVNASTVITATSAIAVGDTANVEGKYSIAIGRETNASANVSIAIGSAAQAHAEHGIALGEDSTVAEDSEYGIAVGTDSVATGDRDIFIGRKAGQGATHKDDENKNFNNIGIGEAAGTNVSGSNIIAIGTNSADGLKGSNSIAIGSGANSQSVLGLTEEITTDFNVAIGERTLASGGGATALGYFANATGSLSSALGNLAKAEGALSVAVGPKANATKEAATAVGHSATASGHSAFAGGNGAKALANHTVALGSLSNATVDHALALGYAAESTKLSAIAMGNRAKAAGIASIALGVSANATEVNAIAIGNQAKATHQGAVALGIGSETAKKVNTQNATVNGIKYGDFAGQEAYATVSVGSDDKKRTITNVAAGRISQTSTDAINGSQLYMTQMALGNVANNMAAHLGGGAVLGLDGSVSAPSYALVVGNPSAGSNTQLKGQDPQHVQNLAPNIGPATTVSDAFSNLNAYINKGFLVQENGTEQAPNNKATVTPGEALNFVNGGNTRARVAQEDEKGITNIAFDITGLPIQYTTADGSPVVKVGDKYYQVKEDGTPDLTKPIEETAVANLKVSAINPVAKPNQTGDAVILDNVKSGLKPYGETTANTDSPIVAPNPKAGLVDLNTQVNGKPISDNTVATVGDLRHMGWVIGTPDNKAEHAVKNAELVNFKGSDGINVKGKTNATTGAFEVEFGLSEASRIELEKKPSSGTASEFTGRVTVAQDDPNNGTGFVSAKSVIDAINDSGWHLNANATDGGELVKSSDKAAELIKPGREVTFLAGDNLSIERNGANITFATKQHVDFNTVTISTKLPSDPENPNSELIEGSPITLVSVPTRPNTLAFAGRDPQDANSSALVTLMNIDSKVSVFGDNQTDPAMVNGLINLDSVLNNNGSVNPNSIGSHVATLGDLARMGWVMKTPENGYSEQVRHAEVVNFIGSGLAQVQGERLIDGEATIVVHVEAQEVISKAQLPVVYTTENGDKVVKIGDKFYKDNDVTEIDNKAYPKGSVRAADGNVYVAGTELDPNGLPVEPNASVAQPFDGEPLTANALIASMNNGGNETTSPMQLSNVAAGTKVFGANRVQPTADSDEAREMAGAVSKAYEGLADLANSKDTNVLTVADAKNLGWVISTLHGNGYVANVTNANHVDFVGKGLATVTGETDEASGVRSIVVEIDSANVVKETKGTLVVNDGSDEAKPKGSVSTPDAKDSKLATTSDVANAINQSGWNINAKAGKDGELVAGSDIEAELINPGREVVFETGKNLKVERKGATLTFATKDDVTFESVTTNVLTLNGKDGQPGKNGVTINGKDGTIGLNGKDGANATFTFGQGPAGVDGKGSDGKSGSDKVRIVYTPIDPETGKPYVDTGGNPIEENVATLNDGLKFVGNDGKEVVKKLNETLAIKGGFEAPAGEEAEALTEAKNVYVAQGEDGLVVKLAKKPEFESLSLKGEGDANEVKLTSKVNNEGNAQLTLGDKDGKTVKLSGVARGDISATSTDAVNGAQLYALESTVNAGWDFTVNHGQDRSTVNKDNKQVDLNNTDGNIVLSKTGNNVTFNLAESIDIGNKLTVGEKDHPNKPGKDGEIAVNGKNGASVVLNGKDGTIGLTGPKGENGKQVGSHLGVDAGRANLDGAKGKDGREGESTTRMVYQVVDPATGQPKVNQDGTPVNVQVATLEDGFRFTGDDGKEVKRPLNSLVTIKGGADLAKTKLADGNIGVVADPATGALNVKLAKDVNLGNDGSLNVGGVVINQDGINAGGKQIKGVKDGTEAGDAVNVGQLNAALGNVNHNLQKMNKDLRGGVAGALAAAGLYHATLPGKSMVAAGVGTYQGQSAVAVGYSRLSDNGRMGMKFTINANTRGQAGASASVGYQW
ncbi:MAG: YadA-like family protein [Pasteurellaceae bacterium]|nr:YadA-like family protein [Pasteurellaceae bacterium]